MLELTEQDLIRCEAELVKRDLAEFVRGAWHAVEPGTKLVWNWHLDLICDKLMAVTRGEIRRLVICIPPGHMKSLLVSVMWPAWEWLTRPETRSQFISNADDLAARDSRRCRDIIKSEWYQSMLAALGSDWTLKSDQNEKINYENSRAGFRQCMSINAKVTGKRADKQIIDDPHDAKETVIGSTDQVARRMDECRAIYDGVLASRLNDLTTGARVIIMQRLHINDLAAHAIELGYEVVCLPSEYDPDHPQVCEDDPRTEPGDLLFPAKFPQPVIDELRANPNSDYDAQHRMRPKPRGGTLFKSEWCPRYDRLPAERGEYIQSWDFRAGGAKSSGSWAVGMLFWRSHATPTRLYLVALKRGRWSPDESKAIFETTQQEDGWREAALKVLEEKADGIMILSQCRHTIPGMVGVKPTADKESRARQCAPYLAAGGLALPRYADWLGEFDREVFTYPGSGSDDQVDTISQIFNHLFDGPPPKAPPVFGW